MRVQAIMGKAAVAGDYIKDQTSFAQYYEGWGYYGNIRTLDTDRMYNVQNIIQRDITIVGTPQLIPMSFPLATGWNYVPCPYQISVRLRYGVPNLTYHQGDLIKSQYIFSQYYEGFGWVRHEKRIQICSLHHKNARSWPCSELYQPMHPSLTFFL